MLFIIVKSEVQYKNKSSAQAELFNISAKKK